MLLPNKVLVYGDCAINTDPNAEQLALIAQDSAMTALKLGIQPRVALLSYVAFLFEERKEECTIVVVVLYIQLKMHS